MVRVSIFGQLTEDPINFLVGEKFISIYFCLQEKEKVRERERDASKVMNVHIDSIKVREDAFSWIKFDSCHDRYRRIH